MKFFKIIISLCFTLLFFSCASIPSATTFGPRTLILNDTYISEDQTDSGFTAWYCLDYITDDDDDILAEVGYFSMNGETCGFVLYDGTCKGTVAYFHRQGLDYRWDWDDGRYAMLIKDQKTALYYDFSVAESGEAIKPRRIYKAHKR